MTPIQRSPTAVLKAGLLLPLHRVSRLPVNALFIIAIVLLVLAGGILALLAPATQRSSGDASVHQGTG